MTLTRPTAGGNVVLHQAVVMLRRVFLRRPSRGAGGGSGGEAAVTRGTAPRPVSTKRQLLLFPPLFALRLLCLRPSAPPPVMQSPLLEPSFRAASLFLIICDPQRPWLRAAGSRATAGQGRAGDVVLPDPPKHIADLGVPREVLLHVAGPVMPGERLQEPV